MASLQRCLVYCRLRPSKGPELTEEPLVTLQGNVVKTKDDKSYNFDGTHGQDSTQEEVFEAVAKPCLDNVLAGYKGAIMAYGQTGTGKSFTLCCNKPGLEGIVPRAAKYLFDTVEKGKSEGKRYTIQLQFLQIYRDNLGDLMSDSGKDRVDIVFDKDKGVTLPGCSIHEVTSTEQFMKIYTTGDKRRVVAATAMNPESSRGHSALVVWVGCVEEKDGTTIERNGKITFIDLAGYERFSKTGITADNSVGKEEAKTINASLLALGHVVSSLSNGDKHIPWRDSKLTRLLQDSIGGRSRTTIVLTCGPSPSHLFETTNTLQFGARAMAVKVQAKVTESVDYERLAAKLQALLSEREERINALELQAANFSMQEEELATRHTRDMELLRAQQASETPDMSNMTQEQILAFRHQQDVELQNLVEQQKEELRYAVERSQQETREIVENLTLQHERASAAMELRIQELEEELADARKSQPTPIAGEPRKPTRKSTLSDLPDIEAEIVGGRIDVGLYYQAIDAYEEALEIAQEKAVDLKVRLDKALKVAQERAEDLYALQDKNAQLQSKLTSPENIADAAADIIEAKRNGGTSEFYAGPMTSRVAMIDEKVHKEIVKGLEQEVKEKEQALEALRRLIYSGDVKAAAAKIGLDLSNLPMVTPRFGGGGIVLTARLPAGMTPRTARGTPQCYGSSSAQTMVVEQMRVQLQMIQNKLDDAESRNVRLNDELSLLKLKVAEAESDDEEETTQAAPVAKGPVPMLALKLTPVPKTKKDKIAQNPLIQEVTELREQLAGQKKENDLLNKEFGALLTLVDFHEFRTERDMRTQLNQQAEKLQEGDIKVTARKTFKAYVNFALQILKGAHGKKKLDTICLVAHGTAITVAVQAAEALRRSFKGLYQDNVIGTQVIHDLYEGQESGRIFEFDRKIPTLRITLSVKPLDKRSPGFQEPLPADQVKEAGGAGDDEDDAEADGSNALVDVRKKVQKDRREDRREPLVSI